MSNQLLNDAKAGNASFYIQFGGQGAPWLKELSAYYDKPEMKKFFEVALSAIEKAVEYANSKTALPKGLNIRSWLDNPDSAEDADYQSIAAVSMPMIQVTQFAHYENLKVQGLDHSEMLAHTKGTTGHSQGLIPATFAAMDLTGDAYYDALDKYIQYLLLMGVRAQEVFTEVFPTDAQNAASEELGAKAPAPMVAVLGEDHATVEAMVAETNKTVEKPLYVSLYNSPSNRIVSGFRDSLIAFHKQHKDTFEEKKMKYVYLRTSCPFHCELMTPIKEKFAADIEHLGFHFKGSDLKVPVFSFADGRNMQSDDAIGMKMCEDLMINTLYWDKAMKPAADDASITHIIDLGPGKTSQRLSADTLKGFNCETPVLAAAVPKDQKTLFA